MAVAILFETGDFVIKKPSIAGDEWGVFAARDLKSKEGIIFDCPGFCLDNADLSDIFRKYLIKRCELKKLIATW